MAKKLFDFVCGECSHEFEKLTATKDKVECPNCGSMDTHVQLSTPPFKINAYDKHMKVAR